MTIKELQRRLDRLTPTRLVVLARLPDGTVREMSAPECVEAGADFIKVLRGNDLADVDLLLSMTPSVIN